MNEISKMNYALELLSPRVRQALMRVGSGERDKISEIHMRKKRYLSAALYGKEYFITCDGRLMNSSEQAFPVSDEDMTYTISKAFKGSVHSFPREMSQGYITCEGGNRVGFCGTAVCDPQTLCVTNVKNISSINIRIAREVLGCASQIYRKAFGEGISSLIIASPPCGGKTTVLRDLCRMLSEQYRISIIDERSEFACVSEGAPQNDVGYRSDIFNSYEKSNAVMTSVRVMSPEILVCDEIGSKGDLEALEYAVNSGVRLVCSCHAASMDELRKRPAVSRLIKERVFDYAAFLGTGSLCGKLTAFNKLRQC